MFKLGELPYIVMVQRDEVSTTPDDSIQLAIYAPGTICARYWTHREAATGVRIAYLVQADEWFLEGSECVIQEDQYADPKPWRTALEKRHALAGTGLALDWRKHTKSGYWRRVRLLGLIWQVEGREILRNFIHQMTRDKQSLSPAQERTVNSIIRERGKGDRSGAWQSGEFDAHYRVIVERRDAAFRITQLADLGLEPTDRSEVEKLQSAIVRRNLYGREWRTLRNLEDRYFSQRLQASEMLAYELAVKFDLDGLPHWADQDY